jgi:glycosyltransferase involved in cell wall biosynthesis
MNNNPLVSILVPVYNVEQYIERCARSIFEQTYENLEYIFVDDCTPDNSIMILEQVLAEYSHRINQVKIIRHAQNEGLAVARNTSIGNAAGVFVFIVDSDDYIEKDAISTLLDIQEQTDADVVTGRMYINEDGIDSRYLEPFYKNKEEMLQTILSSAWHHEIANRLIRRSLFINHGIEALPRVDICEDWQLSAKVVYYADTCVTAGKFTYHYNTLNPNSLVHEYKNWRGVKTACFNECESLLSISVFFKGTRYEEMACSFLVNKLSSAIDLSVDHHDNELFEWCRSLFLSFPSKYQIKYSWVKISCIKLGYYATCIFLFIHQVRQKIK